MKNFTRSLICIFIILAHGTILQSQIPVSGVLISSAVDCQKKINQINGEIKKYENRILKSQNTITHSETIQKNAREAGNKEAERIAAEAISNSSKTIRECREYIVSLRERRSKYQSAVESIRKAMGQTNKVNAVALDFTGQVSIIRTSGEKIDLKNASANIMEAGDIINTSSDGKVDLEFMEGRGKMTVGPDSKVRMIKEKDSSDVVEIMKGEIYSSVLKADEYEKKMTDLLKNFKADSLLSTIGTVSSFSDQQWHAYWRRSLPERWKKKFELRTPAAVTSVRGTKFGITVIDENTTELLVTEGTVEIKPSGADEAIVVEGGQVCRITRGQACAGAIPCDTLNINKWWLYEK